jgi:hypothetical protein
MSYVPIYMSNLSYFGVLTTRLTFIPRTVPCYVISTLATYPACHNLLHLTVLTMSVGLATWCSFCLCNTILATYPACRNLLHLTVLTISVDLTTWCSFCLCDTILATYPAQCNLLHFTQFRSILIMPSQFVSLLNAFLLQVFGLTLYIDLSISPCCFLDICLRSSWFRSLWSLSGLLKQSFFFFWYFADRASQYIYLNINQLCSKHVEAWNKLIKKFSASSWLILR